MNDLLSYDPLTGLLIWKVSRGNKKAGSQAGSLDSEGYRSLQINGKKIRATSVIWFLVKGYWPDEVDHIDRNPDNNRWNNLREVTHQQNCLNRNRKLPSSGFRGVYARGKKWQAKITTKGHTENLGIFETPELASEAYQTRARQLHEEYFPDV